MREIKFRGKRMDNDEWVTGLYVVDSEGIHYISHLKTMTFDDGVNQVVQIDYEVYPETVGEYTGLKDKNGVEIFEGDVVRRMIGTSFVGSFVVEIPRIFFPTQCRGELEVVGTIHDKPTEELV